MKICPRAIAVITSLLLIATGVFAKSSAELVRDAVSSVETERTAAITELRALGNGGLNALFDAYSADIAAFEKSGAGGENWQRIAAAIDAVAMQKDAYASKLFWHTDLDAALAEASRTGRPVLSLRMLGNLNEEFSCANSRFFRAILYSDPLISAQLREKYVLHWRSVRPVPKVTIDFGDGRKIERTLTGNSIHYVLSPNGEIIDGLPGLYGPKQFLGYLNRYSDFSSSLADATGRVRQVKIAEFRRQLFNVIRDQRSAAIAKAGVELREPAPARIDSTSPRALDTAPLAVTKAVTEAPILRDLDDNFSRFEPQIVNDEWTKLAAAYAGNPEFGESSVAFIRRQNKSLETSQFDRMMANLRSLVALDTTRNDFYFHMEILRRLNDPRRRAALEDFNASVYNELFKTPNSDRWLGMYSEDVYTGLNGNGIR